MGEGLVEQPILAIMKNEGNSGRLYTIISISRCNWAINIAILTTGWELPTGTELLVYPVMMQSPATVRLSCRFWEEDA